MPFESASNARIGLARMGPVMHRQVRLVNFNPGQVCAVEPFLLRSENHTGR